MISSNAVPIETIHLFPELDRKLIELLRSLSPDDWNKPTLARLWTVKDIAAHLLDGNMRFISMLANNYFGEKPGNINSYHDLVGFLNELNADWVKAMRRVSPELLISLLESTGPQYCALLRTLEPLEPAIFSVAWAGEDVSKNWFHIAREYTEKWHHQQQIRHAVNKPGIMEPEYFKPLIQTFMQAMPHTYRNTMAEEMSVVRVSIEDDVWNLIRMKDHWTFTDGTIKPSTTITLDAETAWKLFTKGIARTEAESKIQFRGSKALGEPILSMLSVMA